MRERALAAGSVAVIGSGQSAAEIFADVLEHGRGRVDWFTRSAGFLPMEYSKLGLEHFSPEYTAYFHALPEDKRDALRAGQDLLYKGMSAETSERIFDLLYRRSIDGEPDVRYSARCELRGVDGRHGCSFHQLDQGVDFTHEADVTILATGYEPAPIPVPGAPAGARRRRAARWWSSTTGCGSRTARPPRCSSRTASCTRTASARPTSGSARTATR